MNYIKKLAIEYYKENIEGEPLTQDVPISCYIEGYKKAEEIIVKTSINTIVKLQLEINELREKLSRMGDKI